MTICTCFSFPSIHFFGRQAWFVVQGLHATHIVEKGWLRKGLTGVSIHLGWFEFETTKKESTSGQIKIFHQHGFPWNKGNSLPIHHHLGWSRVRSLQGVNLSDLKDWVINPGHGWKKLVKFTKLTNIYTWNPNDLYFWRSTPQNKAFSNQNKGHLGSRYKSLKKNQHVPRAADLDPKKMDHLEVENLGLMKFSPPHQKKKHARLIRRFCKYEIYSHMLHGNRILTHIWCQNLC